MSFMNFILGCPYVQDVLLKLLCSRVVLFFILFSLVNKFVFLVYAGINHNLSFPSSCPELI